MLLASALRLWAVAAAPEPCPAPAPVDLAAVERAYQEDVAASLAFDRAATRCFDPEGKRAPQASGCAEALPRCEQAALATRTPAVHGVDALVLARLEAPVLGRRFVVTRRPVASHPAPGPCKGAPRAELFLKAIAQREAALSHAHLLQQAAAQGQWVRAELERCRATLAPVEAEDASEGQVDGGSEPTLRPAAPTRLPGRAYLRLHLRAGCVAEVLPGPLQASEGDWLVLPEGAERVEVRAPCEGTAQLFVGAAPHALWEEPLPVSRALTAP